MRHVARMLTHQTRLYLGATLAYQTAVHPRYCRYHSSAAVAVRAAMGSEASQCKELAGNDAGRPLLSVAPMMDWTDVHYRQLARIISKHTWLWTEMVVDRTILNAEPLEKWLWFPPEQRPIVLQLGGSNPELLHQAAQAAAAFGYDEINLNCGCPSDRVAGAGCFGASLMLEPQLVADCMAAIAAGAAAGGSNARVSVKCRLGVDDADSYGQLVDFVRTVSERGGVQHFIIHARKCLLNGLSPAQNRSVPPLRHDWCWALKRDFPHLSFQLNGGITSSYAAAQALALDAGSTWGVGPGAIDGVMIGRAAYNDPWGVLGDADVAVFGAAQNAAANRRQVVQEYCRYADAMLGRWRVREDGSLDPNIRTVIKPILNLFHGERGGKRWKNAIDIALRTTHPTSVSELMAATLHHVPDAVLDAPPRPAEAAACMANNGPLPAPYRLDCERLALPEDRARGDHEPRRSRSRGKKRRSGSSSSCSSACNSDSEAEAEPQQQQQQQQSLQELQQLQPNGSLHVQQPQLELQNAQQQQQSSAANSNGSSCTMDPHQDAAAVAEALHGVQISDVGLQHQRVGSSSDNSQEQQAEIAQALTAVA